MDRRFEGRYDGYLEASFTTSGAHSGPPVVASCVIDSISPAAMLISSETAPYTGQYIWVDLDSFGLVRCRVADQRLGGFICDNLLNENARDRLAIWISWLSRRGRPRGDKREHIRSRPRDARTTVTFGEGDVISAMLIDVSRSGAGLVTDRPVVLGFPVIVGRAPATVTRIFEGGFGVAFEEVLGPEQADDLVSGYEVKHVVTGSDR